MADGLPDLEVCRATAEVGKMQRRPLRAVAPILIPVTGASNGIKWWVGVQI